MWWLLVFEWKFYLRSLTLVQFVFNFERKTQQLRRFGEP
jgi:hypothetical protein